MSVVYFSRLGRRLTKTDWAKLSKDPAYVTVGEYDNGAVRVTLDWVGREANFGQVYPDFHKVFVLNVYNYTADGKLVLDPVDRLRWFATETAALTGYQQFLLKWTASVVTEFGDFKEADNSLTPAAPPDPNRPEAEANDDVLGGVGAW